MLEAVLMVQPASRGIPELQLSVSASSLIRLSSLPRRNEPRRPTAFRRGHGVAPVVTWCAHEEALLSDFDAMIGFRV